MTGIYIEFHGENVAEEEQGEVAEEEEENFNWIILLCFLSIDMWRRCVSLANHTKSIESINSASSSSLSVDKLWSIIHYYDRFLLFAIIVIDIQCNKWSIILLRIEKNIFQVDSKFTMGTCSWNVLALCNDNNNNLSKFIRTFLIFSVWNWVLLHKALSLSLSGFHLFPLFQIHFT